VELQESWSHDWLWTYAANASIDIMSHQGQDIVVGKARGFCQGGLGFAVNAKDDLRIYRSIQLTLLS
jgi:hypothetical protein